MPNAQPPHIDTRQILLERVTDGEPGRGIVIEDGTTNIA